MQPNTRLRNRLQRWGIAFGKNSLFGLLAGVYGGVSGIALYWSVSAVDGLRAAYPWLLYLLPAGGLLLVLLYRVAKVPTENGTRRILQAARSEIHVPLQTAAVAFAATALSHLGGSTGREGAAMEMGGSFGGWLSEKLRLSDRDRSLLIISGMSAAFSGGFGTPLAGALLAPELVGGKLRSLSTLWCCLVSSLVAYGLRVVSGAPLDRAKLPALPAVDRQMLLCLAVAALIAVAVGLLFRLAMSLTEKVADRLNPYLRIAIGGVALVGLTLLVGTGDYNDSGLRLIHRLTDGGNVAWYACLLKILFTALTLPAGYRGGEVVPSLTVGATAGCAAAAMLGLSPPLGAAAGAVMVFTGATGCPLAAIAIGWELFAGFGWYMLPTAVIALAFGWAVQRYLPKKH